MTEPTKHRLPIQLTEGTIELVIQSIVLAYAELVEQFGKEPVERRLQFFVTALEDLQKMEERVAMAIAVEEAQHATHH